MDAMMEYDMTTNMDLDLDDLEYEAIPQLHLADANVNEGPVFKAVRQNDIPRLSAILFTGYDINSCNENEDNPEKNTYYDIRNWHQMVRSVRLKRYTHLHLAVAHSKVKVINYLISKGADVNITDANSLSPLSLAAAVQRADVTKILINAGAFVDSQSVSGRTPLIQAIGCNNLAIVRQLLKAGANPDLSDIKGTTPLLMCLQARKDDENNLKVLQTLIDAGCKVDLANKQGATALMYAVTTGRLDAVDILLKNGADINLRDKAGQTVMHLASGSATAVYLMQHGATSDWPDNKGTTPLDKAARVGHLPLMNLYLESDSKRTPAMLEVPRVMQVRQQIPLFDQWLQEEFGSPRNLRRLCRQVIRQSLSPSNTAFILSLPVPSMVQDFLLGKHLELVFKSRYQQQNTVPTLHP